MPAFIEGLNHVGAQAVEFAWPMFWQSSLLISVMFAVDWALRRRVRAAVRYALWWVVLLKLVLPPSLALPTGPGWWLRHNTSTRTSAQPVLAKYGSEQAAPSLQTSAVVLPVLPAPERLSVAGAALVGTAGVSLALLLWMLVRWRYAARVVRASLEPPAWVERMLDENRRALGLGRPLRLRLLDQAISPAVCGLFRPVILVPRVLVEELSPAQLRSVLVHELVHLRRGDVWANCFQVLLQAAYWWHPLLWFANARMRRVREEAVDDAVVLALRGDGEAYAATLFEVAKLPLQRPLATLGLVGILESRSCLRQRIERLLELRPARNAGLSFASVLCVLAFGAFALPMGQAPEQIPGPGPSTIQTAVVEPLLKTDHAVPQTPATAVVSAAGTNFIPAPQGRPMVMDSLNRIRLAPITFYDLPLREVVQLLTEQSRKQDPEGKGVRFTILTHGKNSTGTIGSSTGFPTPAQVDGQSDIASTLVSVKPLLSDAKLVDVVDAIVRSATPPLKWTVLEDGVAFSTRTGNETPPLFTRVFKVDPNTFSSGLRRALGLTGRTDTKTIHQNARDYFASVGVDLAPPKSIFYNDREGAILVRGTLQDLDAIEAAVQVLNMAPPQINLKATFWELPEESLAGFWSTLGFTNIVATNTVSILTPAQARSARTFAEASAGADLLNGASVTTLSGRQTQIQVVDLKTIVTNINPQALVPPGVPANGNGSNGLYLATTVPIGPTLDVVPSARADGFTVQLRAIATVSEFLGYDPPTNSPTVYVDGKKQRGELPLPRLRVRSVSGSAILWDGQTFLLNGSSAETITKLKQKIPVLGDIPGIGRLFRSESTTHTKKRLLVLITPTLIDAAGNRLHTDDAGERPPTPPPQSRKSGTN